MFDGTSSRKLSRRSLFGAAALLIGGAACAHAEPVSSSVSPLSWLAYERRLRARLDDAGGGVFDADFAHALLPQANGLRAQQGLAPYQWDESLADCARAHAADMAGRGYFAHEAPEGFTHLERVSLLTRDLCGQSAENLAWRDHYPGGSSPGQFETLWEQSPPHRQNLLRPTYGRAGYGVVRLGAAYYAVGVYAEAAVQLARPLPLSFSSGPQVRTALDGASPSIERFALTAPFQTPTQAELSAAGRELQPGVWQLRPLRAAGGARFDVLSGPLFFVS